MTAVVSVVSSLGAPLLPTIARDDHVSFSSAQWLLTATLLVGAVTTPTMARLADGRYERAVVFTTLPLVAVGCAVAATSDGFVAVVIGRALQGLGLGLLSVTIGIARRHLAPETAGRTIAGLSITGAAGVGLGYPVTGLLEEVISVRAAFWFGAIAVLVTLVVAIVALPARHDDTRKRLDPLGALLLGLCVTGICIVLSEGQQWDWDSFPTLAVAIASLMLVGLWVPHELRADEPIVDLRHARRREVFVAECTGFILFIAIFLFIPVIVEFVQVPPAAGYGFGASAVTSGLVLVPMSAGTVAASFCVGRFANTEGAARMIPAGALLFALSTAFLVGEHQTLWEVYLAAGAGGLGIGLTVAALPSMILRATDPKATGGAIAFYQVGQSVGKSVGSALVASLLAAHTAPRDIYPRVAGFTTILFVASVLCFAAAMISYSSSLALDGTRAPRSRPS